MKRILAMLLSVICVLSFTCVSTYADEKSEDEEKAASIAESYLSAAAKNMWLYESNNSGISRPIWKFPALGYVCRC